MEENEVKHLFLLCPNNSGSSYINECFSKSKFVSTLDNEGQLEFNFFGKKAKDFEENIFYIFTKKSREFKDDDYLNWLRTEAGWTEKWESNNPEALWRFQKSPTDILRPHILLDVFVNLSFLIMVRDPYAMAESIMRLNPEASLEDIANHCIDCLITQRSNNYLIGNNFTFKYEDMCDRPEWVEKNIKEKYNIDDFSLSLPKNVTIKNKYESSLTNKNKEHFSRLKKHQIDSLNNIFKNYEDTLDYWGYKILDETKIGFKLNKLFEYDITPIKEKILNFDESLWHTDIKTKNFLKEHSKTDSIILFSKKEAGEIYSKEEVNNKELMIHLKENFQDLFIQIKKHFNNTGQIGRILLARLNENSEIPEHKDHGTHLENCRRIHIPIKTNENVYFIVDNETFVLEENSVYEFDNTKIHNVINNSDEKRIHLIIDWIYNL